MGGSYRMCKTVRKGCAAKADISTVVCRKAMATVAIMAGVKH